MRKKRNTAVICSPLNRKKPMKPITPVASGSQGQRLNPGWRKGVRIGRASDGEVLYFIPPHFIWDTLLFPSGITVYSEGAAGDAVTVDADGNIYAGEVGTGNPIVGITKYIRRFELGN